MDTRQDEWTPERRAQRSAETRAGLARARARRERELALSLYAIRALEERASPDDPIVADVLAESRDRLVALLGDLGEDVPTEVEVEARAGAGEDALISWQPKSISVQERMVAEGATTLWITVQLLLLWLLRNPSGKRALDVASKIASLVAQERASLVALGLGRRSRDVVDLTTYLRQQEQQRAQAAQDGAGAANADDATREPATRVDGREGPSS